MGNSRKVGNLEPKAKTKIGFRGDSRRPDEIFANGFVSRDPESDIYYRDPKDFEGKKSSGGDIDPTSAVAVSWRLRPTAYFPIEPIESGQPNVKKLWIYVVDIDLSSARDDEIFSSAVQSLQEDTFKVGDTPSTFTNTHGRQVLDLMSADENKYNPSQAEMLYADEFAVKEIKKENILFAVECKRDLYDPNNPARGGKYILGRDMKSDPKGVDILSNPYRKDVPKEKLDLISKFLEAEIDLSRKQQMKMPTASAGYKRYPEIDPSAEQQILNQLNEDILNAIEDVKRKGQFDPVKNKWANAKSNYSQQHAVLHALSNYLNDNIRLVDLQEIISANKNYKKGAGLFFKSSAEKLVNVVLAFKQKENVNIQTQSMRLGK